MSIGMCACPSSDAEQQIDEQLVEPLVGQRSSGQLLAIERVVFEPLGVLAAVPPDDDLGGAAADLGNERLNLRILPKLLRLLFQHEIGAHAAPGEIPNTFGTLGSQGVRVEVPRTVVARFLQQLHDEEERLDRLRSES